MKHSASETSNEDENGLSSSSYRGREPISTPTCCLLEIGKWGILFH